MGRTEDTKVNKGDEAMKCNFHIVCVTKVRMAGVRDVFQTEDSCVIVNNVFLIPAQRVDYALFFAFGVQFVQFPTLALRCQQW